MDNSPGANKAKPEYSTKVLIGNWVEDRQECPPNKNMYREPADTTDYSTWTPESRKPDMRVNKLNDTQGSMPIVLEFSKQCRNNFLSTTDLVYNHEPKPLCGPPHRSYRDCEHIYVPQPDLMKCVGNLTEWGLSKDKEWEWKCTNVSDHISTAFQDTYTWPPRSAHVAKRYYRDSRFTKSFASLLKK